MIDSTTYQQWRKLTFYALKQQFSNVNDSILEDAISDAYFQMWEDSNSDEPSLRISQSTLKYLSKCRTIDALRKYRHEVYTETIPENIDYQSVDCDKDELIQLLIEKLAQLNPRHRFLIETKYKIKDLRDLSTNEIRTFLEEDWSDAEIAEMYDYPSTGAVRAARYQAVNGLRQQFRFRNR
jgi:hypothetical protein